MTDVQGKLLIAPPKLPDWRFQKSVIYIWKHNISGASGIIINKKCDNPKFEQVCREGNIHRNPEINPHIFYGGPILTNLIGCVHSIDYKIINEKLIIFNNFGQNNTNIELIDFIKKEKELEYDRWIPLGIDYNRASVDKLDDLETIIFTKISY